MRGPAVQPIVIAAGGTGGHFFPAEALAAELVARGHRVVLMTDARSGGLTSPVFAGREQYVLRGAGIAGRGMVRGAKAMHVAGRWGRAGARHSGPDRMPRSSSVSAVIPASRRCLPPSAAPAAGGDPARAECGAGTGEPVPRRRADVLALGFDATELVPGEAPAVVTGNPVRPAIGALAQTSYDRADRPDQAAGAGRIAGRAGVQRRRAGGAAVPAGRVARRVIGRPAVPARRIWNGCAPPTPRFGMTAELSPFFPNVAARLAAAHLVIARAGASTVAELAVAGRPAILVPLPGAIDDHQIGQRRARWREAGGAWVDAAAADSPGVPCRTAKRAAG